MGSSCLGDSLSISLFFSLLPLPRLSSRAVPAPTAALGLPRATRSGGQAKGACAEQLTPTPAARKPEGKKLYGWEGCV